MKYNIGVKNTERKKKMTFRKITAILLLVAMSLTMLAACGGDAEGEVTTAPVTENTEAPADTTEAPAEETTTETTDAVTEAPADTTEPAKFYNTITIAEALALCEKYVESPSSERYYIRGIVKELQSEQYGQMIIEDSTGSIMVYGSYSADGTVRYSSLTEKPVVGDEVLFYGTLQNYKGNTKEIQSGWIIEFKANGYVPEAPKLPAFDTALTVAELLALPLSSNQVTEGRYYVTAKIESVTNATYGAMVIADSTGSISVYNSKSADGKTDYQNMTDKPVKGDEVKLYCTVQNYNGTYEIKSAYIVEFKHNTIDESAYTSMSIADARNAAEGAKVKVEGVVAAITYATGMVPSGVILVDNSGSIYLYDGDLAATVAKGNKITVAAEKTWWVLDTEQANAQKFGYKGCNQLTAAWLLSNDKGNHDFDKSWITESTVKNIVDTPVTEDVSSILYKVTALIKEVPGSGFTNYYIFDLDGETGTYSYSQCNGGDFEWLRAFDGKICTVYVMALNAKSTVSDCFWRFLPVAVIDEGFDPASVNAAEFAVKYYAVPQFKSTTFSGDPALELLENASSDIIGFSGIKFTYTSNNTSVVSITSENGKTILHCNASGTAVVTVKAEHNGKTYTEDITFTVTSSQSISAITVVDAIASAADTNVTVKGIVGPSLVNQSGFYLIDETGIIAVLCDASVFDGIKIGNEVVIEGVRTIKTKGGDAYFGQTHIAEGKVVANYYGTHSYTDSFFVTDKTVADFYALDPKTDYSTTVFVLKAKVEFVGGGYSTSVNLVSGDSKISLYCSGSGQYSWLQAYDGQEVTLEVAACNWNSKDYWRGCVLAVRTADGKVLNELNFAH